MNKLQKRRALKTNFLTFLSIPLLAVTFMLPSKNAKAFTVITGGNVHVGAIMATIGMGSASCTDPSGCSAKSWVKAWFFVFLLESSSNEIDLAPVDQEMANAANLSPEEYEAYANFSEELSDSLQVIGSKLTAESTVEDFSTLLDNERVVYGDDLINAYTKIAKLAHANSIQ